MTASQLGKRVAKHLNCSSTDLICLRSKSAQSVIYNSIVSANEMVNPRNLLQSFNQWSPIIDGKLIQSHPLEAIYPSIKPLLIGGTSEECVPYVYRMFRQQPHWISVITYLSFLFKSPTRVYQVIRAYANDLHGDLRKAISIGCTDLIFTCPMCQFSQKLSKLNEAPIYHYVFDHAVSYHQFWGDKFRACKGRVCHGGDLSLFLHNTPHGNSSYEPNELILADTLAKYLGNFAHTGDPNNNSWSGLNSTSIKYWPPYTQQNGWPSLLMKAPKSVVVLGYKSSLCSFWNTFGYNETKWDDCGLTMLVVCISLIVMLVIVCRFCFKKCVFNFKKWRPDQFQHHWHPIRILLYCIMGLFFIYIYLA